MPLKPGTVALIRALTDHTLPNTSPRCILHMYMCENIKTWHGGTYPPRSIPNTSPRCIYMCNVHVQQYLLALESLFLGGPHSIVTCGDPFPLLWWTCTAIIALGGVWKIMGECEILQDTGGHKCWGDVPHIIGHHMYHTQPHLQTISAEGASINKLIHDVKYTIGK